MVLIPVTSHKNIGLRHSSTGSAFPQCLHNTTLHGHQISGLQSFSYVQASTFARHPGRSYRYAVLHPIGDSLLTPVCYLRFSIRQLWLLLPSSSRFVTSPCPGYANCPNRAIDSMRTFTSQNLQPCRLLRYHLVQNCLTNCKYMVLMTLF